MPQPDDKIAPLDKKVSIHDAQVTVKRRFQFSSLLKRMSTISLVSVKGAHPRALIAVKGAPETLRPMFIDAPADYEETYKGYAQMGSRVLALGYKWVESMNQKEVRPFSPLLFEGRGNSWMGFGE